jgi:HEAT repeat protein
MKPYLQNLLQRLADDSYRPGELKVDGVFENVKTFSWQAHEEVRTLADETLLPDLYAYIESSASEEERRHAYFVVGFIAKNTNNEEAASFLLNRLKKEKQTFTLITLLDRLAELYKPETFDLSTIYHLIDKKGALIRKAAYLALTNTGHKVEAYLLEKLSGATLVDDIAGIVKALEYVGTEKAVLAIKPLLKSRKLDIKFAAQNYLPAIMVRAGFPITEICRTTKVSTNFVSERATRILEFTRPG